MTLKLDQGASLTARLREWADGDIREIIRDQRRMGVEINEADGEIWASLMGEAAERIESLERWLAFYRNLATVRNGGSPVTENPSNEEVVVP